MQFTCSLALPDYEQKLTSVAWAGRRQTVDPHAETPWDLCPLPAITTQTPSAPLAPHRVKVLKVPSVTCPGPMGTLSPISGCCS